MENNQETVEDIIGEIDPEWQKYWEKLIDDSVILVGLLVLKKSLFKSDYPDEIRKKLSQRIEKIIKRYDEPFRRQKGYSK